MSFVHLHARSHYSFLDGAMSPKELVSTAKLYGMASVAMTDASNLCGVYEFHSAAKDAGIRPIFGCELWVGRPVSSEPSFSQMSLFGSLKKNEAPLPLVPDYHLVLLVEDKAGYQNLCRLISLAHRQLHYVPLVSFEQLRLHSRGLSCLTGGQHGPVGRLEAPGGALKALGEVFVDRLHVEVLDWGLAEDEVRNAKAVSVAQSLGLPVVATNGSRYRDAQGTVVYNVLRAIAVGHTLHDADHGTDQAYFKPESEMVELFPPAWLEASVKIAERCSFKLETGGVFLPDTSPPKSASADRASEWAWLVGMFPPPAIVLPFNQGPPPLDPEGWDIVDSYFAWYARSGLEVRLRDEPSSLQFGSRERYVDALEMELAVIQGMKFPAYHLIVAEFINWAKDSGISVGPGRGSAAGSVVVWSLRITDVNPFQFGLMFERFLNPKRISMPDIDVDFEQVRRDEVIRHVRDKYGEECVSQILTIGTMKAKGAIRDCARACAVHFMEADGWSKQISEDPKAELRASIDENPWLSKLYAFDPKFRNVAELALSVEKRPRQTGVHAAGVIITNTPISKLVPTHSEREADGSFRSFTGVEMGAAEKLGLVKFDFLGLKTLDIIQQTIASVARATGVAPNPTQPLFDDPEVFRLLRKGDALGLFQVESDGMRSLLRRMGTDHMNDIVAISALYRPGPLGSGMVDQYVECKNGRSAPEYPHPLLEEVLRPTYGVFTYQEQVMKAAQVLAGFDLGDADLLRRAMGKKKQSEMDQQRQKFIDGCMATHGIEAGVSTHIFDLIDKFAGYGFNKCLSGDTQIYRAGVNADSGRILTIRDLFNVQTAKTDYGKKFRSGRVRILQLQSNGAVRPGFVKAVHFNGRRPVFKVQTLGGRELRATACHRLLTQRGYVQVDELLKGDSLVVMLPNSCHKRLDYVKGERVPAWSRGRSVGLDLLVGLPVPDGEEDTYDVEMFGPDHNFVANEIVSHNSHSAAYGIITYQTAFLKAHHRAHFMAAAMSFEASNRDKLAAYAMDCVQAGVRVLSPDINRSGTLFEVEVDPLTGFDAIRYGLGAIKGLGDAAVQLILTARAVGSFRSLEDFVQRVSVSSSVLSSLVFSGCFDAFGSRRSLAEKLDAMKSKSKGKGKSHPLHPSFFPSEASDVPEESSFSGSYSETLDRELAALGIWVSGHPLDRVRDVEARVKTLRVTDLEACLKDDPVTLTGVITQIQSLKMKSGDKMVFISLSDRSGIVEVAVPPHVHDRHKALIVKGMCLEVRGRMDRDGPEGRVRVERLESLFEMRVRMAKGLEIRLDSEDLVDRQKLAALRSVLHPRLSASGIPIWFSTSHPHGVSMRSFPYASSLFSVDTALFDEVERVLCRPDAIGIPGNAMVHG